MTGQTYVESEVQPDGSASIVAFRYGQCVLRWSLGREPNIPRTADFALSKDGKEVVVTITNDNGTTVEYDRLPVID